MNVEVIDDGCSTEFRYSIDYLYPSYKITIVMCHI